ncbi:MAG: penicillin-binding protein 2 [Actinobacteria bacterium]|nr:penicillin-binding protein 2 [Actinomycetota bacterium]
MLRSPVHVGRVERPGKKKGGKKRESEQTITRARMQVRVVGLAMLIAVVFVILVFRLWYLQVLTGTEYANTAEATQTRSVKIPAQRGVIYDRNGTVLANNTPGLNVTIVPNAISRDKVKELAGILEADEEAVLAQYDAAMESGNQYSPMLVKENASREDVMYVSERTEEFDGLMVNDDYIRNYPNEDLASHVLGYTGAITEAELEGDAFKGLPRDSVVGKGGVELAYEDILRGKPGEREYNVDALGRQVTVRRADGSRYDGGTEEIPEHEKPARVTDPEPGKDLSLTIDSELQQTTEKELDAAIERAQSNGNAGTGGAAIAIDPSNGEIQAMASRPDFDPQLFVGGITGSKETQEYEYLNSEEAHAPFTNRNVYGGYPAASTFKPFTGMAGLEDGTIGPGTTVTDNGDCWRPTGSSWGCLQSWRENSPKYWALGPHGTQNYTQALMDSNDKFFYQVADWMWQRTSDQNLLPKYYEQFGFGQKTGVDLVGESAGRVPTREWQEEAGATPDDQLWTVGRWVNLAIGQGDLLATPLQLARGFAAIENGGNLVTPHVGREIQDQNGNLVEDLTPAPAGTLGVSPQTLQTTIDGLRRVTGKGGTAEDIFKGSSLQVVGKSGTGEVAGKDYINWFVGWAEHQEKPLVVLVMVEGGGAFEQGSEDTAGPAVRHILEYFHGASSSSTSSSTSSSSDKSSGGSSPTGQQPSTAPIASRPSSAGGSATTALVPGMSAG